MGFYDDSFIEIVLKLFWWLLIIIIGSCLWFITIPILLIALFIWLNQFV